MYTIEKALNAKQLRWRFSLDMECAFNKITFFCEIFYLRNSFFLLLYLSPNLFIFLFVRVFSNFFQIIWNSEYFVDDLLIFLIGLCESTLDEHSLLKLCSLMNTACSIVEGKKTYRLVELQLLDFISSKTHVVNFSTYSFVFSKVFSYIFDSFVS